MQILEPKHSQYQYHTDINRKCCVNWLDLVEGAPLWGLAITCSITEWQIQRCVFGMFLCVANNSVKCERSSLIVFVRRLQHRSVIVNRMLPISRILALMLLTFTTRRMVRSAYLSLSPMHFTAQLNFAFQIHTASFGTQVQRDGLISALVPHIKHSSTTWSTRLKARVGCGNLCRDEPISPSQRCRMHLVLPR